MKYLMWKAGTKYVPVLFPDNMHHRDFKETLEENILELRAATLVSAGKVRLDLDGMVICYDYSHGLGIKPDPNDDDIIERSLGYSDTE